MNPNYESAIRRGIQQTTSLKNLAELAKFKYNQEIKIKQQQLEWYQSLMTSQADQKEKLSNLQFSAEIFQQAYDREYIVKEKWSQLNNVYKKQPVHYQQLTVKSLNSNEQQNQQLILSPLSPTRNKLNSQQYIKRSKLDILELKPKSQLVNVRKINEQ
ncbi:Hypothetical_protein [Hexamita inflata]|uniref:Hypothetical_protein n=1 Tax=Hexamita inflata TaxID=28002 RepID=A0AA86P3R6_9EUKA|nr:Hypothetical protein HINF_LOCUS17272 [Hexamita inflata]